MNILMIVFGTVLAVTGIVRAAKPDSPQEVRPKSNDKRIVLRHDGKYVIESYVDRPAWQELGPVKGYCTLEQAKSLKKDMEAAGNPAEKQVIAD